MSDLHHIRGMLTLWGRISRAVGIGYPTMAATEKARIGRGGAYTGPALPDDIAELDVLVSRAPNHHKLVLVETYTKGGNFRDHAARLRISVNAYYGRRKRAEVYLNSIWRDEKSAVSYALRAGAPT